jgi:hypothetical protein
MMNDPTHPLFEGRKRSRLPKDARRKTVRHQLSDPYDPAGSIATTWGAALRMLSERLRAFAARRAGR